MWRNTLKIRYAETVLDHLERDKEWSSDTLEAIGEAAHVFGLAMSDSDAMFKRVEDPSPSSNTGEHVFDQLTMLLDFCVSRQEFDMAMTIRDCRDLVAESIEDPEEVAKASEQLEDETYPETGDGYVSCGLANADEWYDFRAKTWKLIGQAGYFDPVKVAFRRKKSVDE